MDHTSLETSLSALTGLFAARAEREKKEHSDNETDGSSVADDLREKALVRWVVANVREGGGSNAKLSQVTAALGICARRLNPIEPVAQPRAKKFSIFGRSSNLAMPHKQDRRDSVDAIAADTSSFSHVVGAINQIVENCACLCAIAHKCRAA